MPNKTLRDIAIEIGINVNTLKSRKARRDYESKRRSPLWKRNGDINLGDHLHYVRADFGEYELL